MNYRGTPLAGCAIVLVCATHVVAVTPISYHRTIRDSAGIRRRVDFRGSADRGRLTGVLTVDGRTVDIAAQIGKDASVSGKPADRSNGEPGSFWGTLSNDQLLGGRFNIGAQGSDWTAPDLVIPVDALPTSEEILVSGP